MTLLVETEFVAGNNLEYITIMARENWNMGIYFPEGQEIFPKAQPEGIS